MSHFTKLDKANIKNAAAFEAAAKELGFTDIRKNVSVKDYAGRTETVDVAARAPGARYDVAIKKNAKGQYDMLSDWWGIRTYDRSKYPELEKRGALRDDRTVQGALLQATTKHDIVMHYRRQGFVAQVKTGENNKIVVTLTR